MERYRIIYIEWEALASTALGMAIVWEKSEFWSHYDPPNELTRQVSVEKAKEKALLSPEKSGFLKIQRQHYYKIGELTLSLPWRTVEKLPTSESNASQ